jgi:hypothetical protein
VRSLAPDKSFDRRFRAAKKAQMHFRLTDFLSDNKNLEYDKLRGSSLKPIKLPSNKKASNDNCGDLYPTRIDCDCHSGKRNKKNIE